MDIGTASAAIAAGVENNEICGGNEIRALVNERNN
jgi:hypothetical protein